MADLQIHTADGWVNLEDYILAKDQCTTCGNVENADGAGYMSVDPLLFYCMKCREAIK